LLEKINFDGDIIDWPSSMTIVAISAGGGHSLILNDQGQVFSFGYGGFGNLGLGNENNESIPTLISDFGRSSKVFIVAVSTGDGHSLLLDSQGRVFSFGFNESGQLGLGDKNFRLTPMMITKIEGPSAPMIAISAGHTHSLILNVDGRVFSFGDGVYGQLGPRQISRSTPTMIKESEKIPIIAISAGSGCSLLLDSQGRVFVFGGRSNHTEQLVFLENIFDCLLPNDIGRVIAISAGRGCLMTLNSEGQICGFGGNDCGQLGMGDQVDKLTPTLVTSLTLSVT
jgi:alpha-tubulin suppressor-like RCC1 family protein